MIIILPFVFEALDASVATGLNQGEPAFGPDLFTIFAVFIARFAAGGRLEEVLAIDPPEDDLT